MLLERVSSLSRLPIEEIRGPRISLGICRRRAGVGEKPSPRAGQSCAGGVAGRDRNGAASGNSHLRAHDPAASILCAIAAGPETSGRHPISGVDLGAIFCDS